MVMSPLAWPVITGAPRLPSRKSKARPRASPSFFEAIGSAEAQQRVEQPPLGAFERAATSRGSPARVMSARLRLSRQAAQRGSAASAGTSQLQPIASALTQRRQRSSGRAAAATRAVAGRGEWR